MSFWETLQSYDRNPLENWSPLVVPSIGNGLAIHTPPPFASAGGSSSSNGGTSGNDRKRNQWGGSNLGKD